MGTVNNGSSNSVVISIALPAGVEVEAGTVSGDGMVSGISGHTRLNTVSGSVLADGTSGDLAVNTVSGEVIARNHRGVLTAKSVSGEVTASGEFSNIRANTVSGDLSFDLHGFTHDFGANSVSGDVTIRLPHDVGVDIVAKSASGAVVIDDQRYAQPGGTVQTIAGPDAKLMLVRTNSVSGKTSIFHGQPAADTETGPLMPPVFAHGALRLYLLALLESGPKHGYELIKALSERFGGTYSPSAGTIYPRLGKLEEEGLVATQHGGPPHQLQHHPGGPRGTEQPAGRTRRRGERHLRLGPPARRQPARRTSASTCGACGPTWRPRRRRRARSRRRCRAALPAARRARGTPRRANGG